ncbi:MAG: hypothetical protein IJV65_10220, partial [Kiritimatiellae bacterium]|nr:hypothetical protein [Kiritimatiellia bacterium]
PFPIAGGTARRPRGRDGVARRRERRRDSPRRASDARESARSARSSSGYATGQSLSGGVLAQVHPESASIPLDVSTLGGATATRTVRVAASADFAGAVSLPDEVLSAAGTNRIELAGLAVGALFGDVAPAE